MDDEDFSDGFMFGLLVAESLGFGAGFDAVMRRLIAVARGEASLRPPPDEAVRRIEADVGQPLPDEAGKLVRRVLADRGGADAADRGSAKRLLDEMGIDPEYTPPPRTEG